METAAIARDSICCIHGEQLLNLTDEIKYKQFISYVAMNKVSTVII